MIKNYALSNDTVEPMGTINEGDEITYTILLRNTGLSDLTNVSFTDNVPAGASPPGLTVTAINTTQGTAPAPSNTIVINDIGTIAAGDSVTITITGIANGVGTVVNQATVSTDQLDDTLSDGDGDPDNGDQPTEFPVLPPDEAGEPVLTLSKRVELTGDANSDDQVNPGEQVRFTLVVQNIGSAAASDVRLEDDLTTVNGTLVDNSVNTSQGSVVTEIPLLVNLGDLPPGGSTIISFLMLAGEPGELFNQAIVRDADEHTAEDDASVPVVVFEPFDPPFGRKVVNDDGLPELEWTMVWINPNVQYTMPLRVVDPVPNNSDYVVGSLECFPNGVSTQTLCEFDEVNQQVVFEGLIGPDPGATDADSADNEIVIVFRTEVRNFSQVVNNQGQVNWDEDGNGSLDDNTDGSQTPNPSDDPGTDDLDDPTSWTPPIYIIPVDPKNIPTLSEWMLVLYVLLLAFTLAWHLRRRQSLD